MIQKIKMLILSFSSLILFAAPFAIAAGAASALDSTVNIGSSVCSGTNGNLTQQQSAQSCQDQPVSNFEKYVKFALNLLSIIVGIAAVIMIIVAGLRYVTSGGKDEAVKGAKNTILYAIIGLVIVALAQVIVHFVLTEASSPSTQS